MKTEEEIKENLKFLEEEKNMYVLPYSKFDNYTMENYQLYKESYMAALKWVLDEHKKT